MSNGVDTGVISRLKTLTPYARNLLESAAFPPDAIIRAELFGTQRFEEHARSLARAQPVARTKAAGKEPAFFPRVEENIALLRRAYDYVALIVSSGHYVTPAAEWLLDNFHLVEDQLQQIREGVPRRYYAELPKLATQPLEGLPRVYGIAWAYVAHTDSVLNPELFMAFLDAYQDEGELTLGELWALPTTLRVVLLENLRRVAEQIAAGKVAREIAHAVWDSAESLSESDLNALFELMQAHGLQRAYLAQLWQRLPGDYLSAVPALVHWIEPHCPDGLALIGEGQASQVSANLTVSNIITTFRLIGQVDWTELIEPVSRSLRVLRQLPSFLHESESTRQQITHAMERLARQSDHSEHEVAQAVLELAGDAEGAARQTAGYFLLGAGRALLQARFDPRAAQQAPRWARDPANWHLPAYGTVLALGTLLLLAIVARAHAPLGWATGIALLLMAWPASEVVASLIQRLSAESTRVRILPRLHCPDGIPGNARTLVVIPTLLTSAASTKELVRQLELHWLANREEHAQFALLTDWVDAPLAHLPEDDPLLKEAVRQIQSLNRRYPRASGGPARFLLLHRPRVWSETQQRWLGWERKRGKLEMLIRGLVEGHLEGFMPLAAPMQLEPGIRYMLTLDSDTGLPAGALRDLVAIAAHPLNAPEVDLVARRVVAGFAILQPHLVVPLPEPEERTPFHAMFAGLCGLDPYSNGMFDLYQDVFGLGSFTGKGLLDVQAVYAVLDRRLPEGAVLSHDLLEGSIARCGFVSDVFLIEGHPAHAGVAASRVHRWTRGDWQLLALMRHARRYGIDALGLWKMADNLRRSLIIPASLGLLIWVIFTGALSPWIALPVTLAAFLAGPLVAALAALVPTRRGIAMHHFLTQGLKDLQRALLGTAWQFSQLFNQSALLLDAIGRTVWRLLVSRRRLLEWTTAAQAHADARHELSAFMRQHMGLSVVCAVLAIASLWGASYPLTGFALFAFWAAAPVAAWWASRVAKPDAAHAPLDAMSAAYLRDVARDTWRFFEQHVGPEDNHLPPDNLQTDPEPMLAHRTSPTNVGLYLMAVASAREFGWIANAELIARLGATLSTMERLPKHDGHLLNWYDTRTLQVLQPAYVSAVDSGNLAGLLLAVAQACRSFARAPSDDGDHGHEGRELGELARRCETLCMGMNFSGLYSAKRHLFHIGLRVNERALDASYYDLLASESRLTSFLAIAKGDVARRHWMALGRAFMSVREQAGLKSWSGSMFEYLMPSLVMPEPDGGLLHVAICAAVREQIAFGKAHGIPWGISESAYFGQDHTLAYQYSPFGVPRLALRRTPAADRVVAPYATLLAAMFVPHEAIANLRRLEQLGARGKYGFIEAVDFTATRQPRAHTFSLVQTVMAHHHGMALVSLCNLLCDKAPRRWFASVPLVQAYASLLHERTPRQIIETADPRAPPEPALHPGDDVFQSRDLTPARLGWQPMHLLSNGRYSVALHANGAGVSRWRSCSISRWRDDLLRDQLGTFIYVCREGDKRLVSLTAHPAPHPGWRYKAKFLADRVQFDANSAELESTVTVLVSPEDDTEIRTLTLLNRSSVAVVYEVVTCFEAVLAEQRADEAHPAFSNLFVQTAWRPEWRALILSRTPRLAGDPVVTAAHFLTHTDADLISVQCLADRRSFAGRNQPPDQPVMRAQATQADGTPINGLDPIAGLRVKLRIAAGAVARLGFATAAAESADELAGRIDKYMQRMHVDRATRMAATLAQVRLRDLGIDPKESAAVQDLTTALMYTTPRPVSDAGLIDQRQLWRYGISGDKPIILVRIHSGDGLSLVHSLLRAQPLWTFGTLATDVVVLNSEPNSYLMPLQRDILALRDRLAQQTRQGFSEQSAAGFFLLREHEVAATEKAALIGLARAIFNADGRPLDVQVNALREMWLGRRVIPSANVPLSLAAPAEPSAPPIPPDGSFDGETGEFVFDVDASHRTPRPWVNIIANRSFGFQVSESGNGYTWATNSRLHQLTPWSNDPVQDPAFEHYLLQDRATQGVLGLTPTAGRVPGQSHRVRHGQGYTVFESRHGDLAGQTTFFADLEEPIKVVQVRLRNLGAQPRTLRALAMVEWQMGAARQDRRTIHSGKFAQLPVVFALQRESRAGFGGATAFLGLAGLPGPVQWTCDRSEFFDTLGRPGLPQSLSQRSGGGYDPCGALAADFTLAPGATVHFSFIMGHAMDAGAAERLASNWQHRGTEQALQRVRGYWTELLGRARVQTPDPLFDVLVNRWLPYQNLACRLWSKAGFYQAGGAFGFRDQLQDALAFATTDPARLRGQILLNASRQFPEGDVQHWWHAPGGEGVRTHFSDDLLWLPYACAHYVQVTGDMAVLDEHVPFIDGPAIPPGQEDAYYAPQVSTQAQASLYEHAARTIDRSLPVGAHGLPLMGTGDWNDGMNRVGHEGRGESVWLAWFLCAVVDGFAPLAEARGEAERAQRWRQARSGWARALHEDGWDGEWFRRAFFDNGHPLGSASNQECRIDLIAQAWSVLSGASDARFTVPAMRALHEQLVDHDAGLLRLLHPPLVDAPDNPGYIQAYPPGVRENGGQYSHAAIWALMAQAMAGDTQGAWSSFEAVSPAHRSQHPTRGPLYELEPYVMAGDIYSAAPYAGRGGWSWYTGSAAWLHRAALECLVGLVVRPGKIALSPRLPAQWSAVALDLRVQDRELHLRWQRHGTPAESGLQPDIVVCEGEWIALQQLPQKASILVHGAAAPPGPAAGADAEGAASPIVAA
ncbi:MAG TPA: glucoamylase family protein [Burkholderiaceae bacterium]|nr:glucoamylase family protein [Burkholderiaceae bacterium]